MANQQMGLIGRKLGMTQIYEDDGTVHPVTVIETGPCTVLQVKTEGTRDGYNALQLGFDSTKEARLTKAQRGHNAKANAGNVRHVREIRVDKAQAAGTTAGSVLKADEVFKTGDYVDVTGVSKGRGFAGVMKRHGFAGFERTHGTHEFFRHGGSIGTRLTPGHVFKGKKMPGHMGAERVTVQSLRVVRIDKERGLVFVRGGVPGPNGAVVTVRLAVKKPRA